MNACRLPGLIRGAAVAGALVALAGGPASAQTIIDRWTSVALPAPPPLQPAAVEAGHTALLVLDMYAASCTTALRPSCPGTVPRIQHLLEQARAHHMLVIFSEGLATAAPQPPAGLAPLAGEASIKGGADKFLGTKLEAMLTAAGIKTVIVVGTSANGSVLYTASSAALRNFSTIVPVDGYSAETAFAELLATWQLKNAPASVGSNITLTRTDLISIR